ncbi:MAG: glycosyl transferase family 1, partial [Muribaculaceae bacterium]|nr:glycosyl transferase family 1 [Muribaculaceae bacterium]
MAKKTDKDTILVTRFSALGDVAMALPVVYAAALAYPGKEFVFLTRKLPAKLFINPPANLTVRGIDTSLYDGPAGLLRLFRELREEFDFSTLVDLHDVLRTSLLRIYARLSGLKVAKINKGRSQKKALTRKRDKKLSQLPHSTDRYRDAFRKAGLTVPDSFSSLFDKNPPEAHLFEAASLPKKQGETWLAIAPFAAHKGKIYPIELMKRVVSHFASIPGMKIFIFGAGATESDLIASLANGHENVVNMAEKKLGFAGELALMHCCDTMLAMDSANMHLA